MRFGDSAEESGAESGKGGEESEEGVEKPCAAEKMEPAPCMSEPPTRAASPEPEPKEAPVRTAAIEEADLPTYDWDKLTPEDLKQLILDKDKEIAALRNALAVSELFFNFFFAANFTITLQELKITSAGYQIQNVLNKDK